MWFILETDEKHSKQNHYNNNDDIQENKRWYQTLWDFAWGKYLINIWKEAVQREKDKDQLKDINNASDIINNNPIQPRQINMDSKKKE